MQVVHSAHFSNGVVYTNQWPLFRHASWHGQGPYGIAKYNLEEAIHSFLVYYMGLAAVYARTKEARVRHREETYAKLCGFCRFGLNILTIILCFVRCNYPVMVCRYGFFSTQIYGLTKFMFQGSQDSNNGLDMSSYKTVWWHTHWLAREKNEELKIV